MSLKKKFFYQFLTPAIVIGAIFWTSKNLWGIYPNTIVDPQHNHEDEPSADMGIDEMEFETEEFEIIPIEYEEAAIEAEPYEFAPGWEKLVADVLQRLEKEEVPAEITPETLVDAFQARLSTLVNKMKFSDYAAQGFKLGEYPSDPREFAAAGYLLGVHNALEQMFPPTRIRKDSKLLRTVLEIQTETQNLHDKNETDRFLASQPPAKKKDDPIHDIEVLLEDYFSSQDLDFSENEAEAEEAGRSPASEETKAPPPKKGTQPVIPVSPPSPLDIQPPTSRAPVTPSPPQMEEKAPAPREPATPAIPAVPEGPGEAATPAVPAVPPVQAEPPQRVDDIDDFDL